MFKIIFLSPLRYCNFHYDIGNSVTMLEIPLQYCYFRYDIVISVTILSFPLRYWKFRYDIAISVTILDNSITMLETLYISYVFQILVIWHFFYINFKKYSEKFRVNFLSISIAFSDKAIFLSLSGKNLQQTFISVNLQQCNGTQFGVQIDARYQIVIQHFSNTNILSLSPKDLQLIIISLNQKKWNLAQLDVNSDPDYQLLIQNAKILHFSSNATHLQYETSF
jgi:hypothetical protein